MLTVACRHDKLKVALSSNNGTEGAMKANISALMSLADTKNWSIPELADHLRINYSYLFRILKGEKDGGAKLFAGIYRLCKEEGLSIDDFVALDDVATSLENKVAGDTAD